MRERETEIEIEIEEESERDRERERMREGDRGRERERMYVWAGGWKQKEEVKKITIFISRYNFTIFHYNLNIINTEHLFKNEKMRTRQSITISHCLFFSARNPT